MRSPAFAVQKRFIWLHLAGRGGVVRLVADGYQLIRAPLHGHFEARVKHGEENVSKHQPHQQRAGDRLEPAHLRPSSSSVAIVSRRLLPVRLAMRSDGVAFARHELEESEILVRPDHVEPGGVLDVRCRQCTSCICVRPHSENPHHVHTVLRASARAAARPRGSDASGCFGQCWGS